MKVSLVVATLHRTAEVERLLRSLTMQTVAPHEVILVDQNADDRIDRLVAGFAENLNIRVVKSPPYGVNFARNLGFRQAGGDIVGFPDDDCHYPPDVIHRVVTKFSSGRAGAISGLIVDETGEPSVGRWERNSCRITRGNVWTTTVESAAFVRRNLFDKVGGFDEAIGPGAPSIFGAHEIDDLFLRLLKLDAELYFVREVLILHAASVPAYNADSLRRAYRYGAGLGYVLRKHGFPVTVLAHFILRSLGGAAISAVKRDFSQSFFYLSVARGRLTGWLRFPARQAHTAPKARS
ncbi:glycosyltransferase family 2 protein [Deinococcus peraridilitoris]|uniref:Putative glycosyltransferase n=1 Tax=Deinococcus peraridilitoris (strain DSM 19664 / LMG 22246 / CIP 109416 / KR-200) TaxID=937777 RepID=L0A0G6_DEIPD|nr:glycosyltransferase [Deinococcus peraridilitoris]AFZ66505.1 putative glycosyltransferase [Deinococcus peraridilitoris DSM 19664]